MKVSLNPSLNIKSYKSSSNKDQQPTFSYSNPPTYNQKVEINTKRILSKLRWVVAAVVFLYFYSKKSFRARAELIPPKQTKMEAPPIDSDVAEEMLNRAKKAIAS